MRYFFAMLFSFAALASDVKYFEPSKDSPTRKSILDAVRPRFAEVLGFTPIIFVRALPTTNEYSIAFIIPLHPNGKKINFKKIKGLEKKNPDGWSFALLKKRQGTPEQWEILQFDFATPDFDFMIWRAKHPEIPIILWEAVGVKTNAENVP